MTLKRIFLFLLTLLAILFSGSSLIGSWKQPQFQSKLELYQTNIVLLATEWQPSENQENLQTAKTTILGAKPLDAALKQYQQARTSTETNLTKAQKQLVQLRETSTESLATPKPESSVSPVTNPSPLVQQKQLQQTINHLQKSLAELDLQIGIIQASQDNSDTAIKTWQQVQKNPSLNPQFRQTSLVLIALWENSPRVLEDAELLIKDNFQGWFRYSALEKIYQIQQDDKSLNNLKFLEQQAAEKALLKLTAIATLPLLGGFIGLALLIFSFGQWIIKGKAALLARNAEEKWTTPWDGETILQVFVVGFFLMGQLVVPLALQLLPIPHPVGNVRLQALYVLLSYTLVASGSLLVLYLSVKQYLPLGEDWFRFRFWDGWLLWGIGGYCAATPIVVIISLVNQQLWQGQGGSNPLLQIVLESQDNLALLLFFSTAAIAAPLFEEFLFRGFLLPSLTRYLPVWGSILLSSFLFAAAHLSLSEILPLTALGIVLGVVYSRTRNLLAPMLLHSLWNSGTLLSLFLLGNSTN
ncbi:MAG: CPBP family intramembrane metalloprotease [Richelia sp. RM2_1_2]|nr:CPBP family intramembrane metalloprotease [Richelia sp. SM1_7_0]NJN06532.1 CPBP family intramembrane metalloprotease [Richelia sp. RM1_1_1]NJO26260.1 CPBP family intramembrane metalloprotease [Richelia sp. SL_2_1]NJO58952.1 CPBP family intramembrane metalloprotease [Richelia sp. RM2_1_2]